ncbi:MAG: hypothetical protein H0W70_12750, partial [Actinobacteria bacterium]|nr:hypothetical protein [Actinomycetota bacterium]
MTAAVAMTALQSVGARGATSEAAVWGTFAHVATGDLGTNEARQAAARYDTLAVRGAITAALLSDLHQRHAGITLLAYEKAAGLSNAEANTLASTHPDWIARDSSGQAIHPQNIPDTTLADLTNADFRAWQSDKMAAEVALGADGAFIDTLGAYFPSDFYTARPVVNGTAVTDAAWRDGSADLIRRVKAASGRMVVANGFGLGSGAAYYAAAADADVLIDAADGVQVENFTRPANAPAGAYRTADQWDKDLAFVELLGARAKTTLAYTKVKTTATAAELSSLRDYALGSFLLSFAPGRSYFGFDDGNAIPAVTSDATWARGLGAPNAARVRSGTDGWTRPFQNGQLTVRVASAPVVGGGAPSRQTATFTGTGSARSTYPITIGAGPVTVTATFTGGSYKTLMVFDG